MNAKIETKTKDVKEKKVNENATTGIIDKENLDIKMQEEYLESENFCVIYGNLDLYAVLDGGKEGGYLIRALKSVLKQRDATQFELKHLVQLIGSETLRLVKGETNTNEEHFATNIQHDIFFF